LFEVVLGQKGVRPKLPKTKPPKIQGWCLDHFKVPDLKKLSITAYGGHSPDAHLVGTKEGMLSGAPCRSPVAAEVDIPYLRFRSLTKLCPRRCTPHWGGSMLPLQVSFVDDQCEVVNKKVAVVPHTQIPRGAWKQNPHMKKNASEQNHHATAMIVDDSSVLQTDRCKGWGSMKNKWVWCGCCWKADRCNGWVGPQYNLNVQGIPLNQLKIARSSSLSLVVDTFYKRKGTRSKLYYELRGSPHVVIWYKPPAADLPCNASGLQFEAYGGDAAVPPAAEKPSKASSAKAPQQPTLLIKQANTRNKELIDSLASVDSKLPVSATATQQIRKSLARSEAANEQILSQLQSLSASPVGAAVAQALEATEDAEVAIEPEQDKQPTTTSTVGAAVAQALEAMKDAELAIEPKQNKQPNE